MGGEMGGGGRWVHKVNVVGKGRGGDWVGGEEGRPLLSGFCPAHTHSGSKVLPDAIGDQKRRVLGPPIGAFAEPDLLVAERLSVGCGGVLLVRRTVADVAVEDEEGGAALCLAKHL